MTYAPISSNAVVFICATAISPLSFAIPQEILNLSPMDVRPDDAIQAYLKTGEHDPMFFAWPGNGVLDKSRIGTASLRDALIAEVLRRTEPQRGPTLDAQPMIARAGRAPLADHTATFDA